jgi:hypothetical protein
MKKLLNYCRTHLSAFLSPEPEIQSDYVNKVVYLLRRDFDSESQNEILVAVATKLSILRDQDLAQMEKDYANLQEFNNTLKHRMAIT